MLNKLMTSVKYQLPNSISLLGTIPVFILLEPQWYLYFPLLASIGILTDDLDGIVARRMGTNSEKGKYVDIICDAVGHSVLLMVASFNHGLLTRLVTPLLLIALILRLATLSIRNTGGTTTNEIVVSLHLVITLELLWGVNLEILLICLLSISLVTINMSYHFNTLRSTIVKQPYLLLSFDILLIAASFVPELAVALLGLHIFYYLKTVAVWAVERVAKD